MSQNFHGIHTSADREALKTYPTVQRWLRPFKSGTHWQYLGTMLYFLDFAGPEIGVKDPDSFLVWAKETEGVEVQDFLEKFGETKTRGQKLQAVSEIRSFLKRNGKMDLPVPGMTKMAPARHHRSYKPEEIRLLMGYLDQKIQKLYVLLAKDSGLRPVHILQVRYRHLREDLEAGKEFVHINLDPPFYEGRKIAGRTFIGPETVKFLKECISEGLVKTDPESTVLGTTYKGVTTSLQLAKRKAKLDPVLQPSMGFRKFFENALDRANLDFDKKRLIEGHSTGVRNRHYTDRDVDELRDLYRQAYRFLDLSGKVEYDTNLEQVRRQLAEAQKKFLEQEDYIKGLRLDLARQREVEERASKTEQLVVELSRKVEALERDRVRGRSKRTV